MSSYMKLSSVVENVGAGGFGQRRKAAAAQVAGRGPGRAGPRGEPGREVRPPAALFGTGAGQPLARIGGVLRVDTVGRPRVAGRVDHGGDVAAGGQHEPRVAAEQAGRAVAALPGGDVVGDAGDDVTVD